eukprot:TRINITY_DN177_c0_g1_i14.p1 TRINITY_DN177_c0_g1~~TRINITY_DN177_c0_g1_i14.p1  ORF type:complete len:262 (+),score=82.78 TRINITY_DN177_c0_g1_i14:135-920(+)
MQFRTAVLASALVAVHSIVVPESKPESDPAVIITKPDLGPQSTAIRGTSVALALLADGVDAWPNLMGSKLHDPPAFLELLPTTLGDWSLPQGTDVKFTCPDSTKIADVCEAWVFFYSCPHSCSGQYQGGVPGLLMVEGWTRGQCAPRFTTGVGSGFKHPMGSLRKHLARGESYTFTVPNDAEFLAFGIDKDGEECGKHTQVGQCPVATGRCKWESGACVPTDCKNTFSGPFTNNPCPECPWEGLVPRPPIDGPFHLLNQNP